MYDIASPQKQNKNVGLRASNLVSTNLANLSTHRTKVTRLWCPLSVVSGKLVGDPQDSATFQKLDKTYVNGRL